MAFGGLRVDSDGTMKGISEFSWWNKSSSDVTNDAHCHPLTVRNCIIWDLIRRTYGRLVEIESDVYNINLFLIFLINMGDSNQLVISLINLHSECCIEVEIPPYSYEIKKN